MKCQLDAHNEDHAPAVRSYFTAFQHFQQTPSKQAGGLAVREDMTDRTNASPVPLLQNLSIGRHQPKPACLQDFFFFMLLKYQAQYGSAHKDDMMGHAGPTSLYKREKKAPTREKTGLQTLPRSSWFTNQYLGDYPHL